MPGFAGFKPQHQKGEALKEYVSILYSVCSDEYTKRMITGAVLKSVDLTELAKEGKLDPVIGRDEGAFESCFSSGNFHKPTLL